VFLLFNFPEFRRARVISPMVDRLIGNSPVERDNTDLVEGASVPDKRHHRHFRGVSTRIGSRVRLQLSDTMASDKDARRTRAIVP
jgi:hypothetical protein